jgi:dihydrofolate synthase / folylpolyglutamate synthase
MRFTTLEAWLHWQERLHPRPMELGLERVAAVWRRLRPQGLACPVVTVGGTNGKGSCCALLEAILAAAGYRTGAYTSPHLLRYNERVRIHGSEATDAALCAAFDRVDQARGDISLTYFEMGTLAALDLFAAVDLDLAILEVGLGGRLDAVNLVDADVILVTTVDLDHTAWLGPDRASIAREKAGIFRAGRPAVIGERDPPAALLEQAAAIGARPLRAGIDYDAEPDAAGWTWRGPGRVRHGLPRPALRGARQIDNAAAVLMVLECLRQPLPVGQDAVRAGLHGVCLAGRLQVLPGSVTLVLDVAHNVQAAAELARDLAAMPCAGRTHAVFACLADKDAVGMLRALGGVVGHWHLVQLQGPRARPLAELAEALGMAGSGAAAGGHASVAEALDAALRCAAEGDRILVTGSFLTVAAALEHPVLAAMPGLV